MATFSTWKLPPGDRPESLVQLHNPVVNLMVIITIVSILLAVLTKP